MEIMNPLNFDDISSDAPHTQQLVKAVYDNAQVTAIHLKRVHHAVSVVCQSQSALSNAYRALSSILQPTSESIGETSKHFGFQFATLLDEFVGFYEKLSAELRLLLLSRLEEYMTLFDDLSTDSNALLSCSKARDEAFHAYMKLPKGTHVEAVQAALLGLANLRLEFDRTATLHYKNLNHAENLRVIAPLLTMSTFVDRTVRLMGDVSEQLAHTAIPFVDAVQSALQQQLSAEDEMSTRFMERANTLDSKELVSYCQDPLLLTLDLDNQSSCAPVQVRRRLANKSGRLLMRTRLNRSWCWVDVFCRTNGAFLMSQKFEDVGASLLIDLHQKGVYVESADYDDRRNVFQIVSPSEDKTVVLQTESCADRDEWILTLTGIIFNFHGLASRVADAGVTGQIETSESDAVCNSPPDSRRVDSSSCGASVPLSPALYELPRLCKLNSIRDAALVQTHRLPSSTTPTGLTDASASQPDMGEVVTVMNEAILEPLELGFLGAVELPSNLDLDVLSRLNDVFSYILSSRGSHCSSPLASTLHLLLTEGDLWLLAIDSRANGEDDRLDGCAFKAKHTDVLLRVPFVRIHTWYVCPENTKLACLIVKGPIEEIHTFASTHGHIFFAFESDNNHTASERILAAHLSRLDTLDISVDTEKEQLLSNISRLSEPAVLPSAACDRVNSPSFDTLG